MKEHLKEAMLYHLDLVARQATLVGACSNFKAGTASKGHCSRFTKGCLEQSGKILGFLFLSVRLWFHVIHFLLLVGILEVGRNIRDSSSAFYVCLLLGYISLASLSANLHPYIVRFVRHSEGVGSQTPNTKLDKP